MEAKARRVGDDVRTNSTLRPKQASEEELVEQPALRLLVRETYVLRLHRALRQGPYPCKSLRPDRS